MKKFETVGDALEALSADITQLSEKINAERLNYFDAARDMRKAIDAMELAMMGVPELVNLPERWGDPRLGNHVRAHIDLGADQVYRICDALSELTRIINSDEYKV